LHPQVLIGGFPSDTVLGLLYGKKVKLSLCLTN
jgi:hypothetical protein